MCIEEKLRRKEEEEDDTKDQEDCRPSSSSENESDDRIPIEISIMGKWLPLSSTNTDAYSSTLKRNRYQQILFTSATLTFWSMDRKISQTQYIGDEKVSEHVTCLDSTQQKTSRLRQTTEVIENVLRTENFWSCHGNVYYEVERKFIKDGLLYIENQSQGVTCTRIYRRLEVFHLTLQFENPIQAELPGLWKMKAFMGLKDFVRGQKLGYSYSLLWEQGIQNISIRGLVIQVNHFLPDSKPMLHTDMMHTIGQEQVCMETGVKSTTIFMHNSLVTVNVLGDEMVRRIIRYVTGGRLFVTVHHQESWNFMAIYERI